MLLDLLASEKRQGTKSRNVGLGGCCERYGDLRFARAGLRHALMQLDGAAARFR